MLYRKGASFTDMLYEELRRAPKMSGYRRKLYRQLLVGIAPEPFPFLIKVSGCDAPLIAVNAVGLLFDGGPSSLDNYLFRHSPVAFWVEDDNRRVGCAVDTLAAFIREGEWRRHGYWGRIRDPRSAERTIQDNYARKLPVRARLERLEAGLMLKEVESIEGTLRQIGTSLSKREKDTRYVHEHS